MKKAFGLLRRRGNPVQEEKRVLMNDLDGDRQQLFHLAQLVDAALRSADVRKLRAAHEKLTMYRSQGDVF